MTCRLCTYELKLILDLGETAISNEIWDDPSKPQDTFPLRVGQCKRCDHVQLMDQVDNARLFPPDYPYRSGTTETFRAYLRELAEELQFSLSDWSGGEVDPLIIDIGSNDGSLLKAFNELGYTNLLGIDPAMRAAQDAARRGIQTIANHFGINLADITQRDYGPAALVTALNVMAHAMPMGDLAGGVKCLIGRHGLFVFEVGYLPRQLNTGGLDIVYLEHTSFHHLTPLVPFFLAHGLSLYDAEETSSQGGSIRGYVKRGLHPMSDRLVALLRAEKDWDAQGQLERAAGKAVAFGQRVIQAASKGEVTGYGCPAKLTTLIAAAGGDKLARRISRIYDDAPEKIGRYTPGTHIPIVSADRLEAEQPAFCVLFSYNFKEEVFRRRVGFKGEWLVP